MMKKQITLPFYIASGILILSSCSQETEQQKDLPNIVLIMADDMGYSDISCYGGEIETPNLDRLANQGVRFTEFYNGARCCPTRASLLTGLYAHQTGIGHMVGTDNDKPGHNGILNDHCLSIAQVLKQNNYRTFLTGKWHVAKEDESDKKNWPLQRGFDNVFGTIKGGGNFFNPKSLNENEKPVILSEDFYYTDAISKKAVEYIDKSLKETPKDPFFLYVAYTAPHWPLHAPDSTIEKYKGRFDKGWDVLRKERITRMKDMGIIKSGWKLTDRDPDIPSWDNAKNKEWFLRRMEVYAAQVDEMDRGIGKIIDALKENNSLDNTLIIFLSDNGGCAEEIIPEWTNFIKTLLKDTVSRQGEEIRIGNHSDIMPGKENTFQSVGLPWANLQNTPFRLYKHYVHEGGISTPLIMHWPAGFEASGELRHNPGHIIDIMATIVDVTHSEYPKEYNGKSITPMQGISLIPFVKDSSIHVDRNIYWEHEWNRALLNYPWKLVAKDQNSDWELYNLKDDRTETNNLANIEKEKVLKYSEEWKKWFYSLEVID